MKNNNSRTMTVSAKLTPLEKIRYTQIAKSHDVSLSEWITSILSIYQRGYGEFIFNYNNLVVLTF